MARSLLAPEVAVVLVHLQFAEGYKVGIGTSAQFQSGIGEVGSNDVCTLWITLMTIRTMGQGQEIVLTDLLVIPAECLAEL
jgi:hypothetical protein